MPTDVVGPTQIIKMKKKISYGLDFLPLLIFLVESRDIHIDYRVLQTIQMRLKLLYVWAEPAVLGSAKTALKFKYEI